jgi:serine/threonine protein kinase
MATRSVFQSSALVSGLVTVEQLEQIEAALRAEKGGAAGVDDELRAARMVELSLLTNYQAEQLKAGRTKLNLGPYIITDWIGQGGMGQVFKAVHKMMGRECAVKVLPMHKATPESIANFAREIRTQAQLDHPHLVRAFDAGHDGKVHYLVTEYVPGTDLRRLVRSRGTLSVQQAANVILQAALGLAYAHSRGLIHRDVKPGNILVTPEGVAKVSDLGLAGYINEGDQDPRAGKIVGTADYLSPEQIQTPREVTKASDIYSLGCTLYYAVKSPIRAAAHATKPAGTARKLRGTRDASIPTSPRNSSKSSRT